MLLLFINLHTFSSYNFYLWKVHYPITSQVHNGYSGIILRLTLTHHRDSDGCQATSVNARSGDTCSCTHVIIQIITDQNQIKTDLSFHCTICLMNVQKQDVHSSLLENQQSAVHMTPYCCVPRSTKYWIRPKLMVHFTCFIQEFCCHGNQQITVFCVNCFVI